MGSSNIRNIRGRAFGRAWKSPRFFCPAIMPASPDGAGSNLNGLQKSAVPTCFSARSRIEALLSLFLNEREAGGVARANHGQEP